VAGLRSDNAAIKARSVVAARELLAAPERCIQCIAAGITPALRELISSDAAAATATEPAGTPATGGALQAAAATTLQLLLRKEAGCRDALQHGVLPPLLQLLRQACPSVRAAAYGALQAAIAYEPWRVALTREGALPALLLYAQGSEQPKEAAAALELLLGCVKVQQCV
jgi:hypothetical protein